MREVSKRFTNGFLSFNKFICRDTNKSQVNFHMVGGTLAPETSQSTKRLFGPTGNEGCSVTGKWNLKVSSLTEEKPVTSQLLKRPNETPVSNINFIVVRSPPSFLPRLMDLPDTILIYFSYVN